MRSRLFTVVILLVFSLFASPVAASQDVVMSAENVEVTQSNSATFDVVVENKDNRTPVKQLTIVADFNSDNLALNQTNETINIDANGTKTVSFKFMADDSTTPGSYSVRVEALQGNNTVANTTSTVTVSEDKGDTGTNDSENSDNSDAPNDGSEQCTSEDDDDGLSLPDSIREFLFGDDNDDSCEGEEDEDRKWWEFWK